ncbi:MAG: hypothetical protein AAFQ61_12880 [Cyanobacteria bacterium J06626_23]
MENSVAALSGAAFSFTDRLSGAGQFVEDTEYGYANAGGIRCRAWLNYG